MGSEADSYEASDSEYDEEERNIMANLAKQNRERVAKLKANNRQEILSFSEDEDEEEDDVKELMRDSDIEGGDDDDLPDTMDWGSNKRSYYNTDFVDPDYSSYNAEEEDMAKAEEEEAKKIQLRLAKQLNEADFQLDDMNMEPSMVPTLDKNNAIKVTTNLQGLTKRERLQLLQQDSPEFLGLMHEFKSDLQELRRLTVPVLDYVKEHQLPVVPVLKFASLYQNLLLTHSVNVAFYLALKVKRISIKFHPVVKRLVQLKQLRDEMWPRYEKVIRPRLEILLKHINDGNASAVLKVLQRKRKLQILDKFKDEEAAKPNGEHSTDNDDDDDGDDMELQQLAEADAGEDEQSVRRGITYQMAKNKGLTPHRRKELRNPRVKHRSKYRKAIIRRKGAVRSVRTEVKRYGGEKSGIKATVTKSVKFKT